jgi:hypothetical protein
MEIEKNPGISRPVFVLASKKATRGGGNEPETNFFQICEFIERNVVIVFFDFRYKKNWRFAHDNQVGAISSINGVVPWSVL